MIYRSPTASPTLQSFNVLERAAKHKLCYLATPYTKHKLGIEHAWVEACTFAANLLKAGISVYSPIAHTHPIARYGSMDPLDHSIWLPFDQAMMDACDAMIVAEMPGWIESKGVQHEIAVFDVAKKPIYYLAGDCFG